MGGTATLGENLIDGLLPIVDDLRSSLNADFGTRPFKCYVVRRHWTGERRGEGTLVWDSETEITPAPRVDLGSLFHRLSDLGLESDGEIVLREVSLTYTEAELTGQPLADNEECFIRLVEGQGQGIVSRDFVLATSKRPEPDREKDIGWRVTLTHAHFEPDPEE